ncbi:Alpha/beta hydrolase fold-1 [Lasiodiplodia theobromae]|uniref:Homoserine o-acetyltransferase n=1 Tax=Lasiodiplodia theobromae TaxID=45133 RepID=UPI0015C3D6EA|nr:Homoserine o-acetyltransferase [Lasiodiplodia theobromae]KAF4544747.1 Homoserine o-acetyltransferase [Lasiodiplodia theobromae]KAF9637880.1 Alpha/beta hydrolase fold-1 [Lasiodiplodia theobromae]
MSIARKVVGRTGVSQQLLRFAQSRPAQSGASRHAWQASRNLHNQPRRNVQAAHAVKPDVEIADSTNPALAFPCLDALENRSATLQKRSLLGPEPSYTTGNHENFVCKEPMLLDWGGILPEFNIAYETWGNLNADKSNAVLLHTGLSASSHAHSTEANPQPGWWEKFIGPGKPLDTDKYFVICTNVIGGCYGSTGPSSIDPANGQRYATRFPILTMEDMERAQFRLLDHLGIDKLYASVGSSMGGMLSLAAGVLFPERVGRIVSISGCARSHPYSIAMRHTQRQVLMMDPNWNRGFYYDAIPPHSGMKLAREIATVTYRSGPEWEQRFGRRRADASKPPALCADFLIETYLDHAGEKWCLQYDANSMLYVSKAMDLFDLGLEHRVRINALRAQNEGKLAAFAAGNKVQAAATADSCNLTLPEKPYEEQEQSNGAPASQASNASQATGPQEPPADLVAGLKPLANIPTLVLGVASDILFPAWQQREIAETLRRTGNRNVTHVELGEEKSMFGHDTFLLDLEHVGGAVKDFLG